MKTKGQLLYEFYHLGSSRKLLPDQLRHYLWLINNAPA